MSGAQATAVADSTAPRCTLRNTQSQPQPQRARRDNIQVANLCVETVRDRSVPTDAANQLACTAVALTAHSSLALRCHSRRPLIRCVADRQTATRITASHCSIDCSAHPFHSLHLAPPLLPSSAAMSLVGMDGKAIQFETKPPTQAPIASPFQLTNKFAFDLPNSPAAAAASAASAASPAAAAASSTGGGLFSSQPIALPGQPGAFAPSLPQRSAEPAPSVKIDFSEFENVSDAAIVCLVRWTPRRAQRRDRRVRRKLTRALSRRSACFSGYC